MSERNYHNFIFFNTRPNTVGGSGKKGDHVREFRKALKTTSEIRVTPYSLLGLKSNMRFMLWLQSPNPQLTQEFIRKILKTNVGSRLELTYTLFGIRRKSIYSSNLTSQEQAIDEKEKLAYLIVYPFTKTARWYLLPFATRKKLMSEHINIGRKHVTIRQILLYAFGIDDHEFIVCYETDSLTDFQDLIIEMRSTKVRLYTHNDLPIFSCIHTTIEEAIETALI